MSTQSESPEPDGVAKSKAAGASMSAADVACERPEIERPVRSMYDRVAQVIEIIRPAIQADEGDIFLRNVDEATGLVSVELVGACISCPASTATLKDGIERIMKKRIDGITSVVHVGAELAGADAGTAVSL